VQQNKVGEQKLFKRFGHFSLAIAIGFTTLNASGGQSFADFKKSQKESFQSYKDERDNAFNSYLKEQFKAYKVYMSDPLYEKPKPAKIKPTKESHIKPVGPKVSIKIKLMPPVIPVIDPKIEENRKKAEKEKLEKEARLAKQLREAKQIEAAKAKKDAEAAAALLAAEEDAAKKIKIKEEAEKAKLAAKIAAEEEEAARIEEAKKLAAIIASLKAKEKPKPKIVKRDINFEFYGSTLGFDMPNGIKEANFYPQNQAGISSFFSKAASSDYENLIDDVKKVSKDMNLNDWGVYLLVLKLSDNMFVATDNSKLMSWFIFNKLGYAVKVGLANKHIVLMHYSKKTIYATPNYSFGKKKYYVVANYAKGRVGRLFSYKQDYPGSTKPLDLSLETLPNFASDNKSKTLEFKQFGKTYIVPFEYNKNLIDFMATYPQADYETFFNAPLADDTYKDIASGLKKYVDGKKASDAMNFVLNFVQKSFKYERDDQQFGREKVMFAEETLYFDKSDCEDRAVLFSYLMKELFHVPVVGVKYSDHMATALFVPIKGDKIIARSKSFVVADPTYINANIGMSMPKYKSKKPQSYIVVKSR